MCNCIPVWEWGCQHASWDVILWTFLMSTTMRCTQGNTFFVCLFQTYITVILSNFCVHSVDVENFLWPHRAWTPGCTVIIHILVTPQGQNWKFCLDHLRQVVRHHTSTKTCNTALWQCCTNIWNAFSFIHALSFSHYCTYIMELYQGYCDKNQWWWPDQWRMKLVYPISL